jgi:hypothetical protein
MSEDFGKRRAVLADLVDRQGADFARWTDRDRAAEARRAVLADRDFRDYHDGAVALERGLAAAAHEIDMDIAASAGLARVDAALAARLGGQPRRLRYAWLAAAATVLIAAGLGGVFDLTVLSPSAARGAPEVASLDPLGFGLVVDEIR